MTIEEKKGTITYVVPYETLRKHPSDFLVKYRFYTSEEGGRRSLPYQGYRSDFAIDSDFMKNSID